MPPNELERSPYLPVWGFEHICGVLLTVRRLAEDNIKMTAKNDTKARKRLGCHKANKRGLSTTLEMAYSFTPGGTQLHKQDALALASCSCGQPFSVHVIMPEGRIPFEI